tara:strand:+ start:96 stop:290 length:195 start_codon:yes stop_codon:yes gene_type:complete
MSIEPSPLRPQTTMAIEKVKTAAKAAHAKVKSIFLYIQYNYKALGVKIKNKYSNYIELIKIANN